MITIKSTDNLYLAAVLLSKGYKLEGVDNDNPKRQVFRFHVNPTGIKLVSDFYAGKLRCEPNALFAAQKQLKNMLYDRTYGGGV